VSRLSHYLSVQPVRNLDQDSNRHYSEYDNITAALSFSFLPPSISALLPITGRNEEDPAVPVTTGQAVRAAAAAAAREVEVEVEIPKPVRSDSILLYCSPLACPSVTLHLNVTYSTPLYRDEATTMCLISSTSSGGENKIIKSPTLRSIII
jgi:hypothetical protein